MFHHMNSTWLNILNVSFDNPLVANAKYMQLGREKGNKNEKLK